MTLPCSVNHLSIRLIFLDIAITTHLINLIDFSLFTTHRMKILVLHINLHYLVQTYLSQLRSLSLFPSVALLQPVAFHQNHLCEGNFSHPVSIKSSSNSRVKFLFLKDPVYMSSRMGNLS